MGTLSGYEFVLECTRYAIVEDCEITTFFLATGSARQSGGITAMDDKLARRQADPNALLNLSLTPSFPLRRCRF
jgi:hypothetical protein